MSFTAAASGLAVFLLSVSVIQGQDDGWGVTYTSTEICALKGSTVNIRCSYTYPSRINDYDTRVQKTFWFTKDYVDLKTDRAYSRRVQHRCENNDCSLRITDLRESDSAEYKFRFITNQPGGSYFGSPGVSLSVTDLQVKVSRSDIHESNSRTELKCQSSCRHPVNYVWYKNGQKIRGQTSASYSGYHNLADIFSCAVRGSEAFPSPSVYAPKRPSVSVSPSGEIVEGGSVTLTCSSDANPAARYTWYKDGNQDLHLVSKEPQLVFSPIQSSDSGRYYCLAENKLRYTWSAYISITVKYPPKRPSVSVSPSGEIVEGSSVTLTCSSDANPVAKYTWCKEDGYQGLRLVSKEPQLVFSSIRSSDSGQYYCTAENRLRKRTKSKYIFIDVKYAPKRPSVSVSPSGEIVEGSSVNLTCSSDANPAARYTWYKENEDSPEASGQIFTITDFRAEHSGDYYCEAQNNRGRHNSTLHLIIVADHYSSGALAAAGTIPVVLLAVISLSVFLWIRKKRADQGQLEEQGDLQYASVQFSNEQTDPLYSNIRPAQHLRLTERQEVVEYAAVRFNGASTALRTRGQDTGEDPAALYSTVNKL
ncbi:B-cell receptor CD22-like isoform X1 [Sebastes umbrosus]|uniref:B-cell receptor CD22-like isoform X1 n=1 Tax=Sebastes umbrosus TaxID=72105 RepID=UPI00189E3C7E|nr:B-cell receptor CD22-like isoform X1 [Sebastes umbrosus]XP_037620175.1 B-cell receptor CD22-like isoform X1 [Sebastes umbrosus]